jgi:selenocysteine lyase/cysteine desulfurase
MRASELVFRCREKAAELFHAADPSQIVFTMNATHGLNIAIRSLAGPGTKVLISGYEHNAVTRPLTMLGAKILTAESPLFDREACLLAFEERIQDAALVVCTMVSNVFGFILPVEDIAALCRSAKVPLIVDASQAAGILPIDSEALGAAFIAMPGHKGLLGPQGTGLLLCRDRGKPILAGGSGSDSLLQEMPDYLPDRLEAGTHNVPGIAGLLAGMEYVEKLGVSQIMKMERGQLLRAVKSFRDRERVELFTGAEGSQSGVLSLRIKGMDCDEAAALLSGQGICLRSGLHCAPLAHRSAGTLDTGTLRLSFSPFVKQKDIDICCAAIRELT